MLFRSTNGYNVTVLGYHQDDNKRHIVSYNMETDTPCEITHIAVFDSTGTALSDRAYRNCDCNEYLCSGQIIRLTESGEIMVLTRTWGESRPYEEQETFYEINADGGLQKIENNTTTEIENTYSYVCFNEDSLSNLSLWLAFEKGVAKKVKYKGMEEAMDLAFIKDTNTNVGGSYPVIEAMYHEIYGGKTNGTYLHTHSGNWDYVKYIRGKDGKVFNFTIDHDKNPHGDYPCF